MTREDITRMARQALEALMRSKNAVSEDYGMGG